MSFKETALAKLREKQARYEKLGRHYGNEPIDRMKVEVIKDAIMEIESIHEDSGWISVSERLPKSNKLVLFTAEGGKNAWVLVGFVHYGKWYNYEDFANPIKSRCQCFPTHWQPLPKPPVTE